MNQQNKPEKMCVLFIIDFIYTLTGGTENQLVKLLNNLPDSTYEKHLLSLRNTEWIQKNRNTLKCSTKIFNIIKLKNPLTLIRFISVFNYIRQTKPVVVVTFFPLSNIIGVILSRLAGVKVILSTRRDYGLWLNRLSTPLLKLVNRYVTRIVANSGSVKDVTCRGENCSPSKVEVIYNGIHLNNELSEPVDATALKQQYGIPPHHLIVGTVAGLRPMKRHSTIIRAAQLVLESRNDVSFVIVGDGILRPDLEALAVELGIQKHVTFVGSQDNPLPFISLFDIAVNSSANEGLSNAIMEYMALGKPCIAAHAGGNPELIRNEVNGYTFELDNHRELASRILNLLGDKEKQRLFSAESQKRIQELSIEKMIDNYDRLFTTLINQQPQRGCAQ